MSLHLAESVLARWQRTGAALSVQDYLAPPLPGDRHAALEQFHQVSDSLPCEGNRETLALSVLAESPGWKDLVFHAILLSHLKKHLARGDDLLPLVEPWLAPPLCLPNLCQVRVLARSVLLPVDRFRGPEVNEARQWLARLVALVDRIEGRVPLSEDELEDWDLDACQLLGRALCFWKDPAMVAVVLAGLAGPIRKRQAEAFLALLRRAEWVLGRAGQPAGERRAAVASLLHATVPEGLPGPAWFLHELLDRHADICATLRRPLPPGNSGEWYRQAAGLLPGFPKRSHASLREAWLKDVLLGWVSQPYGRYLASGLFRTWCMVQRSHTGPPEATDSLTDHLVSLFRAAPAQVGGDPGPAIIRILEEELETSGSGRAAALLALGTARMLNGPLPVRLRARLLARVLAEAVPPATDEARHLSAWSRADGELEQAVGAVGAALAPESPVELASLLWEILLSPRARWPGLRMRLQRLLNLAEIRADRPGWSRPAWNLLRVLGNA
jgi:hypothetical protein